MDFRLVYEGDIKPKGKAKLADVHQIRAAFHEQMKALWALQPLASFTRWHEPHSEEGRSDRLTFGWKPAIHRSRSRKRQHKSESLQRIC